MRLSPIHRPLGGCEHAKQVLSTSKYGLFSLRINPARRDTGCSPVPAITHILLGQSRRRFCWRGSLTLVGLVENLLLEIAFLIFVSICQLGPPPASL
ncbi:hypothetical protein BV22DRAFT_552731 [Leucogyrophana mollusca]|uniref:Uncharacterized protein n=1 Tax=Leucogyrophana mollusca TaxID=85980 RepID=A0ACB8BDL7_9AGAM|nr:hypothetical protein BV22DRAFT_552731 [Leucogyrophana mollusca]